VIRLFLACAVLVIGGGTAVWADGPTGDDSLQTVAERTGFRATARYDDVVALGKRFAASSKTLQLAELGRSVEARAIPLWIIANPTVSTPEQAARSGKLVVLLIGNIHGGEVCGKEALPILARELIQEPDHPLLKEMIIAMVPIFNPDGNERVSKDNRPGQVGPEEGTGQRTNARGLDLNRDFIKLEAPETRALVRFLNRWNPDLVIDTHTTNGSHHRYTITYQGPKNPAGDAHIIAFTRDTLLPAAGAAFQKQTERNAYFYGNFDRDHSRWTTFPATPRFGTTYIGLRNRIAILSEAYAYAPFEVRVRATGAFVRACLQFASDHKSDLRRVLREARDATVAAGRRPGPSDLIAIRSEARAFPDPVTVLGFVEEDRDGSRVATDRPRDYREELVQDFAPTASVRRPFAYVVPARYRSVIDTLQRHGLEMLELREDLELDLEVYRIDAVHRADQQFEGHRTLSVEATPRPHSQRVNAGTIVVRTAQPLGSLAVYLLEPSSDDGLCTWNFFDAGLEPGSDFPVARLLEPVSPLTTPVRPLPEDERERLPITFDLLYGDGPAPNFSGSPTNARWLDDGAHLLQTREGRMYRVDADTGRAEPFYDPAAMARGLEKLPVIDRATAEALARGASAGGSGGGDGRARRGGGRGFGAGFDMDPAAKGALLQYENDLYYAAFDGSVAVRLTSTPAREEMPSFSPDGRFVAFVRDNDLWIVDLDTQTERALTTGGTDRLRNGKADWVYYEEIFNRNWRAYWWSPDSKRIAFMQFDDSAVGLHTVLSDAGGSRSVEQTPYPRSGEANPVVRLGIASVAGGTVRWADLSAYAPGSFLISEAGFWADSQSVFCYAQDRTQTWLDFLKLPVAGGSPVKLFRETTRAWVDNPGPPLFLDDGSFLLPSERTGWRHLYHFASDGTPKGQVTSGEWEVRQVHRGRVGSASAWIYFSGTRDGSTSSHLYRVKVDGTSLERLTSAPGTHVVSVSPDGQAFIDRWSNLATPTKVNLYSTEGQLKRTLDSNPVHALADYRFAPRELVKIKTTDDFLLEGELITPPELDPSKRYPVWVTTYGGPHTPSVSDAWLGGRTWEQMLAQEGIIVFRVDPRCASGKGAVSTWTAYRRLGIQELKDIEEAIAWLKTRPYVDGSRIGISGHSYGGFLTAFALTHSTSFAAGIAGAPVTDWHDYDSIYTERYMSTPQDNPSGYRQTSAVAAARNLHGRLLILHGAIDDNVSLRNTLRFVHALQQANKDFELMIYPGSRHGIVSPHYTRLQIEFIRMTMGITMSTSEK
jgi:dipeptidyl-peptidase 4